MSVAKNFKIILTKSHVVYFPGQDIDGIVQFNIGEKIETTGVHLELTGLSYVSFEEKLKKTKNAGICHHSSLERYWHTKIDLATKDGATFSLTTGTYQYPFTAQLPDDLPTSFECENGCTRYYLRSYISRESQGDLDCLLPFTVITFFNLNDSPYAMRSEEAEDVQTVGCCTSGSVNTRLKVAKLGYVPGEKIHINGECDNKTQNTLKNASLDLKMNITLKATDKERFLQKDVRTWRLGEIQANTTLCLDDLHLVVPPLPSSGSRFCNNIDVHYCLQLTVQVTSGVTSTASVGLIIGNVPLELGDNVFTGRKGADDSEHTDKQLPDPIRSLTRKLNGAAVSRDSDFTVTLDHYFPLPGPGVDDYQERVPLQCPEIKWHPSYLCFVQRPDKGTDGT
ncbi:arrestin domain-containing protein 17-like [Ostrea edulis]|uniref:arrestin domain-containing protein 17-like n=1 Tax=Ostrea edulis TaxID=37623 RepID=UPI00209527D5|nr:arrestin domain-containing protein 17-like [Ostrea edulis]